MLRNDGMLRVGPRRRGVRLLPNGPGGGGYVGPLDIVPGAAAAYSVARKLRAAFAGSLVRIRRASDNAEQDFSALSTGLLDTAAVATFLAATSGFIVTLYDQSGNGRDATQATGANQPAYVASAQNGKPAAQSNNAAVMNLATGAFAWTVGHAFAVLKQVSWTGNRVIFDAVTNTGKLFQLTTSPNIALFKSGNGPASTDLAVGAYGQVEGLLNGASSVLSINNGTDATGNVGTSATSGLKLFGTANVEIGELIFYDAEKTAAQRALLKANQNAFWALF